VGYGVFRATPLSVYLFSFLSPTKRARTEDTEVTEVWEHRKFFPGSLWARAGVGAVHQSPKILRDLRVLRASLPSWSERNGKASMIASAKHTRITTIKFVAK
jgi:hypothetical protein